jgi:microcystin-dependent protein
MASVFSISYGQTSEKGFSFQGYAIDPDGKALSGQNITVKFTVYPKTGSGETYSAEQNTTADTYGVFHAVVGSQKPADFKKLDFTAKGVSYWLKVEVKKTSGGSYAIISDAEMQAVPYARKADNGVPVGTVVAFAGEKSKIPAGWLVCDGQSYSTTDYVQLYNAVGTAWGGSGTSFKVPDLRGMFLRGVDDGRGKDPNAGSRIASNTGGNTGDNVGSIQGDEFKSHKHTGNTTTNGNHTHNNDGGEYVFSDGNRTAGETDGTVGETNLHHRKSHHTSGNHSHTLNVDKTGGSETRPVNAGVFYIIKY